MFKRDVHRLKIWPGSFKKLDWINEVNKVTWKNNLLSCLQGSESLIRWGRKVTSWQFQEAQDLGDLKKRGWSWNSCPLATSCEELTHWKRPWCCEGLGAGGEGADRGWDGWMASPTWWIWVWVNSGSWWWTGRPGMLRFLGSQRGRHDWVTELNWTELNWRREECTHVYRYCRQSPVASSCFGP